MNMNARLLVAIVLICFGSNKLAAQWRDVPIGALPTYYNGGFAGEAGVPRLTSFSYVERTFANRFNGGGYSQLQGGGTFLSADHFLKRLSTGIEFTGGVEASGDFSTSRTTFGSLAISPKISFKGKYTFAPFVDLSYERTAVNLSNDVYSPTIPDSFVIKDVNIRGGFLVNSSRAYLGLAATFANCRTDYYTFKENWTTFANLKFVLQTGYTFQRTPDAKFSFTSQLVLSSYRVNSHYDSVKQEIAKRNVVSLLDLNLMFRYDKWIAGINSAGVVLGYQTNRFKIQITNHYTRRGTEGKSFELSDKTVFHFRQGTPFPGHYTGSISLRYVFRKIENPKMSGF
jgi:hypothetical protein